jgi:putative aldouronate transport system permease protein
MNAAVPSRLLKPKKKSFIREFGKQWDLQVLVIPSLLLIILFSYVPMYGVTMAFQDYKMGDFPGFSAYEGYGF